MDHKCLKYQAKKKCNVFFFYDYKNYSFHLLGFDG